LVLKKGEIVVSKAKIDGLKWKSCLKFYSYL
jgi:hypothetical protein